MMINQKLFNEQAERRDCNGLARHVDKRMVIVAIVFRNNHATMTIICSIFDSKSSLFCATQPDAKFARNFRFHSK
jgi:hypothetical protein